MRLNIKDVFLTSVMMQSHRGEANDSSTKNEMNRNNIGSNKLSGSEREYLVA